MTKKYMTLLAAVAATLILAVPAHAAKVSQPRAGDLGDWRLVGTTHASHKADHDAIIVQGPFDNFRRIKVKVTDAP